MAQGVRMPRLLFDVVSRRRLYLDRNNAENSDGKIVGGYNTTIQDVPYQVYLLLQMGTDYYQCGGSIISERYVLTAAHCLTGITRIYVRAGSTLAMSGGTQYNTTRFRQHPFYNPMNFDYDVGLVNIPGGIALDGVNTKAVPLPKAGATIENGTNILVTGWGDTTENGQVSPNLMGVQVPTVSNDECRKSYSTLTARQFCAGVPEGGKDSCQGDSGGPAVSTDTGIQLGTVSFGTGCARPGIPGVYANLAKSYFVIPILLLCLFIEDVVSRRHHYRGKSSDVMKSDNKIVGGYNTTIQDVPYQVYLLLQMGTDYYQCGGSIISERYVLTAAHCLTGITRIYIRAGSTLADSGGTQYNTSRYRQHPFYNPMNSDYDVGIINVPNGMTLDGVNTRAVPLPKAGTKINNGTNVLVTGWGDTTENGQVSENLMGVQVPTVSNEECRRSYSTLTSRQFCAGVPEGGKDSCQGDSGGPAVETNTGTQLGIVSFGSGCARPGTPGVYTNVAKVRRWIKTNSGV
ncbi:CLIP domain-containing serine protease B9-like [Vanessa atalanta]|uniref:CLIP domain-containing serine protease B9-like n=1 Tax=Vanessa atalanta TaxID=42275 RepID=UPI001FCD68AF|nr:CLIP domain-containing serine protease B9-like [Vanessa atalanta]